MNTGDGELQDKCGEVQIKLGIDDKEWKKLVGNYEGLYGFIKPLIAQEANKAYERGRIDEAKTCEEVVRHDCNKVQQQLLQELMEQQLYIIERAVDKDGNAYPPGYKGSMFVPSRVIQNKLEGLS